VRQGILEAGKPHQVNKLLGAVLYRIVLEYLAWKLDVGFNAALGQKGGVLEHESELARFPCRDRGEVINVDRTLGRFEQPADELQEGCLAAARGTDNCNQFAFVNGEVNVAQRLDRVTCSVGLAHVFYGDDWLYNGHAKSIYKKPLKSRKKSPPP